MRKHAMVFGLWVVVILGVPLAWAQEEAEILKVERKGETEVVITYEVRGDRNADYEVEIYLTRDKDPTLRVRLRSLKGDVEGKIAGSPRKVTWNFLLDYPEAVAGQDYRLKMTVSRPSGGMPWYVYAGASVVVGVAAVLLTQPPPPPPPDEVQPTTKTVPLPPARP